MLRMRNKIVNKFILKLCSYVFDKFSPFLRGKWSIKGSQKATIEFCNVDDLVTHHFSYASRIDHPCRKTFSLALNKLGGKPACIIETGSSAWGTNSSLLFNLYVASFGGRFETVDIRCQPSFNLEHKCCSNTLLHCDDSVAFLRKWSKRNPDTKIDLLYLDSCDVDWYSPNGSAFHGLAEFFSISDNLKSGSLLLIDDTPLDSSQMKNVQPAYTQPFEEYFQRNHFYPGKGALIKKLLQSIGRGRQLLHEYQLLWQF